MNTKAHFADSILNFTEMEKQDLLLLPVFINIPIVKQLYKTIRNIININKILIEM